MNRRGLRMRHRIGLRNLRVAWARDSFGPDEIGRAGADRKPCSCSMCGNPRRSKLNKGALRLTMQERRADEALAPEGELSGIGSGVSPCAQCQHEPENPDELFCRAMSEYVAPASFAAGECPWFEKRGAAAPETKPM